MNIEIQNRNIKDLEKKGITYLYDVFSKKECDVYIKKFENLVKSFEKKYRRLGDQCQVIQNYFKYDRSLLNLVYNKRIDEVLNKVIDKNYVLINSSLTNRVLRKSKSKKKFHLSNHGTNWHHDSRIIGGKRLDKGFSYIVCIMFNDFTKTNGATEYVANSHLIRDKKPKRYANYKSKYILGKAGTVAIIDTALWHKASNKLSVNNRWSLFSYYGPWFMKPYFNYPAMLGKKYKKKMNKKIQKILHYNSMPPISELERINTLTKI